MEKNSQIPTEISKGHYITNPRNALLEGKFVEMTEDLYCLIPQHGKFNDPWVSPCPFQQQHFTGNPRTPLSFVLACGSARKVRLIA